MGANTGPPVPNATRARSWVHLCLRMCQGGTVCNTTQNPLSPNFWGPQALNPMNMRTHLYAELVQIISNALEHSPRPMNFYKV
eukprot:1155150-Pelagomonas_calceolata.AAC.3